jgi:hypothetical protein
MVNLNNHKGEWCPIDGRFCQEGYCPECEIYLKKSLPTKLAHRRVGVTSKKAVASIH